MAVSLVQSLSRLCLHSSTLPRLNLSYRIVAKTTDLSGPEPLPLQRYSTVLGNRQEQLLSGNPAPKSVLLHSKVSAFHTSPLCATTVELKQWREQRVINRFYRLHWGAWIRCRGGRGRSLYRKTSKERWFLKQHVFCNTKQNKLLDKLTLPHWKESKHFADSPYEPYHKRTNCYYFPNHRKFYP